MNEKMEWIRDFCVTWSSVNEAKGDEPAANQSRLCREETEVLTEYTAFPSLHLRRTHTVCKRGNLGRRSLRHKGKFLMRASYLVKPVSQWQIHKDNARQK